jgi:hypothetical protein
MRICLVSILALLMPANFPAGADQREKETGKPFWLKKDGKKRDTKEGNARVFRAQVEIELEQLTGEDTVIGGTPVPGRLTQRTHTTLEINDGESHTCGALTHSGGDDQTREEGEWLFRVKVESVDDARVRLDVSTTDIRTYTLKDGSTRSYNLRLQAAKTVRLSEKFKLDLAGESLLGIKATCVGVIEEKVKD